MSSGSNWNKQQQQATEEFRSHTRVPFTQEEDARLLCLKNSGATWLDVALALERTWNSVQGRHKYLKKQGHLGDTGTA